MLSFTGRAELAAMSEVCRVQLRLDLLPGGLVQADFQSAHQVRWNDWAEIGTVHTERVIVTITSTITSNIEVDEVISRLYEGV